MFSVRDVKGQEECEKVQMEKVEAGVLDYSNSAIAEAIDEYIHSERDRNLLKRRLIDGLTFEKLAEEFGISVRQTKTIIYKGKDRLFRLMHSKLP